MGDIIYFPKSKKQEEDVPVIFNKEVQKADEYHEKENTPNWKYIICFLLGMFFMFLLK